MLRFLIPILLIAAFTGRAEEESASDWIEFPEQTELKPIFWLGNEIASASISCDRVKRVYPVWNVDTGLGARYEDFYVMGGLWTTSELHNHYRESHYWAFAEMDPGCWAGYDWHFADGFSLNSRVGPQWNVMPGYYGEARRSYDEWMFVETLRTPWVSFIYWMRNFYWPVPKSCFYTGVFRSFEIYGPLSFEPRLMFTGGNGRWSRTRFGSKEGFASPSSGVNAMDMRFFFFYHLSENLKLYAGLREYVVLDPAARRLLEHSTALNSMVDLLVATVGIRYDL